MDPEQIEEKITPNEEVVNDTQTTVEEVKDEAEVKTETEVKTDPEVKVEVKKKPPFWQKRIDDLTTQKYNLESQVEKEQREKAALLAKMTSTETNEQTVITPDIDKLATEKAKKIAADDRAKEKFNNACNDVWNSGSKQFTDWEDVNKNLAATGAFDFQANPTFLSTVTELDNGAKVLHYLGNNPDEATRILALPSNRQAIELARLENDLKAPVKTNVSTVNPPLNTVRGTAKPEFNPDDPDQPMDKWLEWREKGLERKRGRR